MLMSPDIKCYIISCVYALELPASSILEMFGKMFFEFCQDSGYDKILQVLGATPRDFLQVRIVRVTSFEQYDNCYHPLFL